MRSGGARAPKQLAIRLTPANVRPVIQPTLPGEVVWTPAGQIVGRRSPILTTVLRLDSAPPSVVAGLAWIDTPHTHLTLIPGPGYVPPQALLPSMRNPMDRYLVPDQRNFFMVTK
jgi:hypothetical protein